MSAKKHPERNEEGNDSPRTTIVGARPPQQGQPSSSIPRGIERLLLLAYESEKLRRELIENRAAMADSVDIELADSERAILDSIPATQIEAMVDNMPPPPPARREFLRRAAASTVALLSAPAMAQLALTGCDDGCGMTLGINPDYPPGTEPESADEGTGTEPREGTGAEEQNSTETWEQPPQDLPIGGATAVQPHSTPADPVAGSRPDEPEPVPEGTGEDYIPDWEREPVTRGIRPDLPPPVQGVRPDLPSSEPPKPLPEGTGEGTGEEAVEDFVPELPEHHDVSRGSRPDYPER